MPVYNKLKIAILAILTSQNIYALSFDPIQVQSGAGNLLYAEMKFRNADPDSKIEASLAESQDLIHLGLSSQSPGHLNFFTRRSGDGTGVIVITSTRPIVEAELNILLKIKEGNATHIQQVKTRLSRARTQAPVNASVNEKSLQPQTIVSEKDIALNLPSSTQFQVNTSAPTPVKANNSTAQLATPSGSNASALLINTGPVPSLNTTVSTVASVSKNSASSYPVISSSTSIQTKIQATQAPVATVASLAQAVPIQTTLKAEPQPIVQPKPSAKVMPEEQAKVEPAKSQKPELQPDAVTKAKPANQTPVTPHAAGTTSGPAFSSAQAYVVQPNESLWKIAAKVAAESHQSIPEVMKKIKADNQHAFIGGNINRMRRGAALNLAAANSNQPKPVSKVQQENSSPKQSAKAKYRINQAEMSLVTTSVQDSPQGSAKEKTLQNQTTPELSAKVMTARQKTVKLQKNVSKLALALQQKDQRIQLLNARLALLQQQLQRQDQVKKPAH